MEHALTHSSSPSQNGWSLTYHVFDYNLDFFEVGALDDPTWKLDVEPRLRYLERALAARAGLWGNHGYEAAYAMVYVDGDGEQLNGSRRYELRFEQPPPVGAFWSVTMYDTPSFYLVANPIVELDTDGRHATCRSRYVVLQATDALPLQPIIAGRYFDRFERAQQWRFAERTIEIDLVGNLSEHLRFDLATATGGARS